MYQSSIDCPSGRRVSVSYSASQLSSPLYEPEFLRRLIFCVAGPGSSSCVKLYSDAIPELGVKLPTADVACVRYYVCPCIRGFNVIRAFLCSSYYRFICLYVCLFSLPLIVCTANVLLHVLRKLKNLFGLLSDSVCNFISDSQVFTKHITSHNLRSPLLYHRIT